MDRNSIFKLKAGQTLYVVSLEYGTVEVVHIRYIENYRGYPMVNGDWWRILMAGQPVPHDDGEFGAISGICFMPGNGEDGKQLPNHMFRQTTSRQRAIRWAKLGWELYGKPAHEERLAAVLELSE